MHTNYAKWDQFAQIEEAEERKAKDEERSKLQERYMQEELDRKLKLLRKHQVGGFWSQPQLFDLTQHQIAHGDLHSEHIHEHSDHHHHHFESAKSEVIAFEAHKNGHTVSSHRKLKCRPHIVQHVDVASLTSRLSKRCSTEHDSFHILHEPLLAGRNENACRNSAWKKKAFEKWRQFDRPESGVRLSFTDGLTLFCRFRQRALP